MRARHAVLLTPSKSSAPTQLLSREHFVRVSPLAATLIDLPASVANNRLTGDLSPLAATASKITALVLGWVENSVFLSDSRGFGVAGSFSPCAFALTAW